MFGKRESSAFHSTNKFLTKFIQLLHLRLFRAALKDFGSPTSPQSRMQQ